MAHPGHAPSHARTSFGAEREVELRALCLPATRAVLDAVGISLCSYVDAHFDAGATVRGV
jgi:chitin disaccharide deacetylase